MKNIFLLAVIIICTAITCQDKVGLQIQEVFTQNMELEKETAPMIDNLVQIRNNINIQGRALTEEEISLVDEITSIEQQWLDWVKAFHAKDLVQVEKKDRESFLQLQYELNAQITTLKSTAEDMLANPF